MSACGGGGSGNAASVQTVTGTLASTAGNTSTAQTATSSTGTTTTTTSATTATSSVATANAVLGWATPDTNVDGTPLVDLAGYHVWYANATGNVPEQMLSVPPTVASVELSSLTPGVWWFTVRAYNSAGVESDFSPTAWITIS
jgi:uncharacterized protein YfaP (DUF2135 family)